LKLYTVLYLLLMLTLPTNKCDLMTEHVLTRLVWQVTP